MARLSTSPILAELRQPSSAHSQIQALRFLKNEIVGHEQKKERWISLGVVECLEGILSTHRLSAKKRQRDNTNGIASSAPEGSRLDDEEARLQAIIIVGSLAHGGPAFITPLRAGQIYPPLLDILCPSESAPSLILAALRSLNSIADAITLEDPQSSSEEDAFLRVLYTDQHLSSLCQILEQESSHPLVQQQVSLAASLVSKTCKTETRRRQLVLCGILDALATKVASFIVTPGIISTFGFPPTSNGTRIQPVGPRARLAPILQAACTIIQESKIRAGAFCCSSAFGNIFPVDRDPYSWRAPLTQNGKREPSNHSFDPILPPITPQSSTKGSSYPPFNGIATWGKQQSSQRGFSTALELTPTDGLLGRDEDETPVISWLVEVVRAKTGLTRLMAVWLIALLYRSGLVSPRRERSLAMLLVPVLVGMLDKENKVLDDEDSAYDSSPLRTAARTILQRTPRVLALWVAENEDFQRAAADADVVKKLSQLLKQSYDPIPSTSLKPMWSPAETNGLNGVSNSPSSCKLGPTGLQPIAFHTLQMRESALIALAAMSTTKDEHRKAIIENGVVAFIIESLKPYDKASENKETQSNGEKLGNPIPILIAACTAARALSRSVSSLRTILVETGLADPIYKLLTHPDLEVKIAATGAVINIILEFSPMREQIINSGVLTILCEHAHSFNPRLRLNAVWALKHLVLSAPPQLKIRCVQELGVGWLKQIICNGTEDGSVDSHHAMGERGSTPIAMGTPNAAGEQVDLLNAMDDRSHGSFNHVDEDDEVNMVDSVGPLSRLDRYRSSRFTTIPTSDQSTSQYTHAYEMRDTNDTATQTARDDLAVQEQGLTFVRNLICGPGASDMVDYLIGELGQDRMFDMFTNLLKPKGIEAFTNNRRSGPSKYVPPPTEIVTGVCYILAHLAGSHPNHRQMLIAKPDLLKLMMPLFHHPNNDVRVSCVWTVINLTWTDNQEDKLNARNRATELKRLGIMKKLQELESDCELDVRERTKMALAQMNELLR